MNDPQVNVELVQCTFPCRCDHLSRNTVVSISQYNIIHVHKQLICQFYTEIYLQFTVQE